MVTQQFYATIDANSAGQRLGGQKPSDSVIVTGDNKPDKNVLIKPKEYMTGYE